MPTRTVRIPVAPPFDLRLCIHGHGWYALAPHRFDDATTTLHTVLSLGERAVDAELRQLDATTLSLRLTAESSLTTQASNLAAQQLRHMLRLDEDLAAFYAMCTKDAGLRWVARRGAGRLMRSATMFEDLMKLLFTTNTSWAATESMTRNLVAAAGSVAPSGERAFPSARQCLRNEAFYRDVVRVGYRAKAALALARGFVDGTLTDAQFQDPQPTDELWERLLKLRGFGPYAAGQAMRLCGHYDRLALDSWCRASLAAMAGKSKAPADRTVERRYARWAPFQGLALWLDLTADWHGEGPANP